MKQNRNEEREAIMNQIARLLEENGIVCTIMRGGQHTDENGNFYVDHNDIESRMFYIGTNDNVFKVTVD